MRKEVKQRKDRQRFARMVAGLIRQAGEKAPVHYDPSGFRLVRRGTSHHINLANAYEVWQTSPPQTRQDYLGNFVRCWFLDPSIKIPTSFEELQSDLLPCVRPRSDDP